MAQFLDHLRQRPSLDELHGVVVNAALAADRVDADDVGMIQGRGRLGLVAEPLNCRGSNIAAKGNTFSATRRPSEICSASYTTPIPPRPTSRRMRKSPKSLRWPGTGVGTADPLTRTISASGCRISSNAAIA